MSVPVTVVAVWAAVFAVGAVLVNDASTAGPLIGGSTPIGSLLGGVIVAVAGVATLWLCLKAAREVGGLLRWQLGGLLVIAGRGRSRSPATGAAAAAANPRTAAAAASIRSFQGRVRAASTAALDASGPRTAAAARAAGTVGRRGLVLGSLGGAGSASLAAGRLAARSPAGRAARPHLAAAAATTAIASATPDSRAGRAGAVAARMARAGTAAWQQHKPAAPPRTTDPATRQGTRRNDTTGGGAEPSRAATAQRTPVSSAAEGASNGARVDGRDPARPVAFPHPKGNATSAVRSAGNRASGDSETHGAGRESRSTAGEPTPTAPTPRSHAKPTLSNDRPGADGAAQPPAAERARHAPPTPQPPRPESAPPEPPAGRD